MMEQKIQMTCVRGKIRYVEREEEEAEVLSYVSWRVELYHIENRL